MTPWRSKLLLAVGLVALALALAAPASAEPRRPWRELVSKVKRAIRRWAPSPGPTGNPPSPRIPQSYVELSRSHDFLVVGWFGATGSFKRWSLQGLGTRERPLGMDEDTHVQAFEAIASIDELAHSDRETIYLWGIGSDAALRDSYRFHAQNGRVYDIKVVRSKVAAPGGRAGVLKFHRGAVDRSARALSDAVAGRAIPSRKPLMLLSVSWGAAVIERARDVGFTRAPAIALAGPRRVLGLRFRENGDYGDLYINRRPDDWVGSRGFGLFVAPLVGGQYHDYRLAGGKFWGISGPGVLVSHLADRGAAAPPSPPPPPPRPATPARAMGRPPVGEAP